MPTTILPSDLDTLDSMAAQGVFPRLAGFTVTDLTAAIREARSATEKFQQALEAIEREHFRERIEQLEKDLAECRHGVGAP